MACSASLCKVSMSKPRPRFAGESRLEQYRPQPAKLEGLRMAAGVRATMALHRTGTEDYSTHEDRSGGVSHRAVAIRRTPGQRPGFRRSVSRVRDRADLNRCR